MRRQGMRPYYWESTTDTSMEPTSQFKVGWASGGKREKKGEGALRPHSRCRYPMLNHPHTEGETRVSRCHVVVVP